jgi:hypothetical protein
VIVGAIVEGHGDCRALPILLRRIAQVLDSSLDVTVPSPYRLPRGKAVKPDELARAVEFMARRAGSDAPLVVLLDADADCPRALAPMLKQRAIDQRSDRKISVVLAKREYEAWFLAAARSLRGQRGLPDDLEAPDNPEDVRSPKAWLNARMPQGYSETLDQPALTAVFDLNEARSAPSFEKLIRDFCWLLGRPLPGTLG